METPRTLLVAPTTLRTTTKREQKRQKAKQRAGERGVHGRWRLQGEETTKKDTRTDPVDSSRRDSQPEWSARAVRDVHTSAAA
jgi:hypothetical protein